MEEALAFTGETGPYIQNGVVRARNILAKLEAEGHRADDLVARAPHAWTSGPGSDGEEGDEVWSLFVLMARSDEVAEQAVRAEEVALLAKHAFAVAQAFHSYYQKPRYSVLHAESGRPARLPRRWWWTRSCGTWKSSPASSASRSRSACDAPAIGVTIENPRQEPEVFRLRDDYVRSVEAAGGLPLIFAPGRPPDARRSSTASTGCC